MAETLEIVKERRLVSFHEWSSYIDSLRLETEKLAEITDEEQASRLIAEKIQAAVKKQIPANKFGILFSGGVDSTLISYLCKKITDNFICYTVGFKGSKDIEESTVAAKELKFRHIQKLLSLNDTEQLFEKTSKILGKDLVNIVNLGVGSVVVSALELAEKDKIELFFSGLGSEEIFAGYQRHEKATDINIECWNGLKTMWERDFKRDYAISSNKKIQFLTPFLDADLIIAAMRISPELKIKNGHKKYILRKAAERLGLKEKFAFRPKIAAQYGSAFDKAITRITKLKGFRYKGEYVEYLRNKAQN